MALLLEDLIFLHLLDLRDDELVRVVDYGTNCNWFCEFEVAEGQIILYYFFEETQAELRRCAGEEQLLDKPIKKVSLSHKGILKGLKERMRCYDMLRVATSMHIELINRHIHHILKIILHYYLVQFLIILEEILELHPAIVLMIRLCLP